MKRKARQGVLPTQITLAILVLCVIMFFTMHWPVIYSIAAHINMFLVVILMIISLSRLIRLAIALLGLLN